MGRKIASQRSVSSPILDIVNQNPKESPKCQPLKKRSVDITKLSTNVSQENSTINKVIWKPEKKKVSMFKAIEKAAVEKNINDRKSFSPFKVGSSMCADRPSLNLKTKKSIKKHINRKNLDIFNFELKKPICKRIVTETSPKYCYANHRFLSRNGKTSQVQQKKAI